jgi:hypothetical protein
MMKKIFYLNILLLISTFTFGQTYFNERYSYENSFTLDFCHSLIQTNDGYVFPGGFVTYDSLAFNRVGIIETDRFGNDLLKNQLYLPMESCDIARQPGSFRYDIDSTGYFSVGMKRKYNIPNAVGLADYGVIFRYNLQMDTLWTKIFGDAVDPIDSTFIFEHCDILEHNELIICGTVVIEGETSSAILIKTDSSGNELWRKYYFSGSLNKAYNVIATPDGGFALSVWKWVFGPQPVSTPFIIKTDSAGNEQWRKYFGGIWHDGPMYLVNAPDSTIVGGYYYCDTMDYDDTYCRDAIVKLSLEGSIEWEKKYGESTYEKTTSSVNVSSEGKIILAGYNYNPFPRRVGYLLNVSLDGDSLWYREYEKVSGQYDANYLYAVIPTDDGGYAASGMVHTDYDQDIWVLKVDSLGCESFDYCWTSLPGVISVEKPGELQVFPNPATGHCTISVPKRNQFETYTLFIYNLMGLKMDEVVVPSGITQVELNLSGYAPGLYSVVTSYKGSITGRGKFVVY